MCPVGGQLVAQRLVADDEIGAPKCVEVGVGHQLLKHCARRLGQLGGHNHALNDLDLLWASGYPKWLKQRISGPFGHLDNGQSRALLANLDRSRLQHVIGAHLSQQNNRPDLARHALALALGCEDGWVGLANQEEGFAWRELR